MTTVEVRAPATTANLGPGYDCLGMALDVWNRLTVSTLPAGSMPIVQVNGEGEGELAGDTDNLTYRAMAFLYDEADTPIPPLELVCQNGIPLSRGMGSSAAAIAGGLVAANALLDERFSANDLLEMAATIEGHPDNVAAAVHGGLRLVVMEDNQIYTAPIRIPADLQAVLFIPENRIATVDARRVLPAEISVADAVYNMSRAALLVAAMEGNRPEYLKIATQDRPASALPRNDFSADESDFCSSSRRRRVGCFPIGQRQHHHGFNSGACNDGGLRNVRRGPVVRRRGSGRSYQPVRAGRTRGIRFVQRLTRSSFSICQMALYVHKYGGSSVADAEKIVNVARRLADVHDAGHQVVTVVSAMGDTTDELIELAQTRRPGTRPARA